MKHSLAKKLLLLAVSGAVMMSSAVSVGASALTTVHNTDDYDLPFLPASETIPKVNVTPTVGGADLSWEAIDGASMYWLYVYDDSGNTTFQTAVNGTSYSVSGLSSGTYGFLVISYINGNWTFNDWTADDIVYAEIESAKTIPAVSVSPTDKGANVSWEAIDGASMYWLYVYGDSGVAFETGVSGTSYSVSDLTPGKQYGFLVISCVNGNWAFSDWTSDDIVYATIPSAKTIPAVSVNPTAGGADVSWEAIDGASMYWLYVYGDSGVAFETGVNGTSYSVSGLTPGKKYGFLVISCVNGNWAFSDWTSDDIVYADIESAKTIPAVSVSPTDKGANVSWEAIDGASMYWLYVYGDSGIDYQTGVLTTSYSVSGLTPGKQYGFLVISCVDGNWAFNDWTSDDIVYATIPSAKTIPAVSVNPTASGADVSWETINGASMYWLYVYGDDNSVVFHTGVNGTSYSVSDLTPGKQYGFLVISCINGNWAFGDWTGDDIVYATIPSGKTIPAVSVSPTASGAEVSWEAINGASMYWLYVYGEDSSVVFHTGVSGTSYSVSDLTPGKQYGFLVISCINGNWAFGDWTGDDIVYATIPSGKTIPAVSVNPTAGGADVSWETIDGASMYWLYVYGDGGVAFQTGVDGTSYSVSNLTTGKQYGFLVISCINGNWAFSDWTGDDIVYATVQ